MKYLPEEKFELFRDGKRKEMKVLLRIAIEELKRCEVIQICEIEAVKYMLSIKRYPGYDPSERYRAIISGASYTNPIPKCPLYFQ